MIDPNQVAAMIRAGMPEADVLVEDPFQDGTHLKATVISPQFAGQSRVAQHRMVYAALGDAFSGPLHALQLITKAPAETE